MNEAPRFPPTKAVGFLLAQVGAYAARGFAERLAPLSLTPSDVGILRLLADSAGISQQELASRLGIHASRLVALVDDLESRALVRRQEKPEDRRSYALHLTDEGRSALMQAGKIGREHNEALCSGLSSEERETLASLLVRIADHAGLKPGIHPGYQRLGRPSKATV
jgi:DNA-binding MarR family transcriptional regulator